MAKIKAKIVKLAKGQAAPKPSRIMKAGDPAPGSFELHVSEQPDGSSLVTVLGQNDEGTVDISGVATLTPPPVSSDPCVTVDPPNGMQFLEKGSALGHADVEINAAWNDGSIGPFSATDHVDVTPRPPGPITGLVLVHGTPT
jgi:hypothetical protein